MNQYRRFAEQKLAEVRAAKQSLETLRSQLAEAEEALVIAEQAQALVQEVAASVQESVHGQIAAVVTRCLATVFPDPYEFRIVFEMKRGKTEARIAFIRDGREINPKMAAGGGVIDVAAFALRVATLMMTKPAPRRLLVLDEPFRFVSRTQGPRVKKLIETLARELGIQFILITHDPQLIAGKVIEL